MRHLHLFPGPHQAQEGREVVFSFLNSDCFHVLTFTVGVTGCKLSIRTRRVHLLISNRPTPVCFVRMAVVRILVEEYSLLDLPSNDPQLEIAASIAATSDSVAGQ